MGEFDDGVDDGPQTEVSAPEPGLSSDERLLKLLERYVVAQEARAKEAKRMNDLQQEFLELSRTNSKVVNPVIKSMGKAVEKVAAVAGACPTCESQGPHCKFWCHTATFPKEDP